MASARKKQEEEHLKILREMVALPHNKHCFDCHQRGPTYINMTIGSFICTSCSGLLCDEITCRRGLNPPHRVKSISMASFSADEMEFIRCRGNDFCRKVWLGLYDSRIEFDTKDEGRMREAMSQRYDRKRWYVQPSEALYEEARRQNETSSTAKSAPAKPLTLLVGSHVPPLSVQSPTPPTNQSQCVQRPSHNTSIQPTSFSNLNPTASHTGVGLPSTSNTVAVMTQSQQTPSVELLAGFSSFPSKSQPLPTSQATGEFADFASFANQSIPIPQPSSPAIRQNPNSSPLMPQQSAAVSKTIASAVTASQVQPQSADKYSALAELESVFSSTSLSGGGGFSKPVGGMTVNWDSSSWNSSANNASWHPAAGVSSVGGVGSFASGGVAPPPPSYSSLSTAAVANPFGAAVAQQHVIGLASPYVAATTGYGFYGAAHQISAPSATYATPSAMYSVVNGPASQMSTQNATYGAPGSMYAVPNGAAPSMSAQSAVFGSAGSMYAVQNGAALPMSAPSGVFGAPGAIGPMFTVPDSIPVVNSMAYASAPRPATAPLQQAQFGTWSLQTPVSNPFMTAPRSSNVTNPFLS